MLVRPLESLHTGENRRTVPSSEGDELAAFCNAGTATCRGVTVARNRSSNVRAVTGGGVRIPRLDPPIARRPLGGVQRLLTGPRFQVIVVRVTGIHAGVKVDNGRAVSVPFCESEVEVVGDGPVRLHNDAVPRVRGVNHVDGFVHQGTNVPSWCSSRRGWEVEVFQETIEFHVMHTIESAELADGVRVRLHEQGMEKRSLAFHRGTEACQHGSVTGADRGFELDNDRKVFVEFGGPKGFLERGIHPFMVTHGLASSSQRTQCHQHKQSQQHHGCGSLKVNGHGNGPVR